MGRTVWNAGKNITIKINNDSAIDLTINRQTYSHGTYFLKLAKDENLEVMVKGTLPGKSITFKDDLPYYKTYAVSVTIESSDGRQVGDYYFDKNDNNDDKNFYGICTAPFTKFKNGDKLIITATIKYDLKKYY